MCSLHCKIEDLLHVCSYQLLDKLMKEMQDSGYFFFESVCEGTAGQCVVESTLAAAITGNDTATDGE